MKKFKCLVCGVEFEVEDGQEPVCPVCGVKSDGGTKVKSRGNRYAVFDFGRASDDEGALCLIYCFCDRRSNSIVQTVPGMGTAGNTPKEKAWEVNLV